MGRIIAIPAAATTLIIIVLLMIEIVQQLFGAA
jgi:hypothetical protein